MRRIIGLICVLAATAVSGEASWRKVRQVSVVVVSAAIAADTATSWDHYELNPVLGRGRFGARQAGIRLALAGAGFLVQHHAREQKFDRPVAVVNLVSAGVLGAVAWRNAGIPVR